jgi:hypothetical protein
MLYKQCCGSGIFYSGSDHFSIPGPGSESEHTGTDPIKRGTKNKNYRYLFFLLIMVSGARCNSQKENSSRIRISDPRGKKAQHCKYTVPTVTYGCDYVRRR